MLRSVRQVSVAVTIWILAILAWAGAPADVGSRPHFSDGQGRDLYIVDLVAGAFDSFPGQPPASARPLFPSYMPANGINAIVALETRYGFKHTGAFSAIGKGFSAYLSPGQAQQLAEDPLVRRVTLAGTASLSVGTAPPWSDTTVNGETYTWGRQAVGGASLATNRAPLVYILDDGVGQHDDLPNVIDRLNVNLGISPVGCYAHATHVAGIVGAPRNGRGVVGIAANVRIVSVSITPVNWPVGGPGVTCSYLSKDSSGHYAVDEAAFIDALDVIYQDIPSRNVSGAAVVNVSMNGNFFTDDTVREKIQALATPSGAYRGALFVQSAGNGARGDACYDAYASTTGTGNNGATLTLPSDHDGIMVIGAVDQTPKVAASFQEPFNSPSELGSNYGWCVDAYAPGTSIVSAYGPLTAFSDSDSSTWQAQGFVYSNYTYLGGTSMAAPHISALATQYLRVHPSLTSTDLELQVRSTMYHCVPGATGCGCNGGTVTNLPSDPGGACINMLQSPFGESAPFAPLINLLLTP